MITDGQRGIFRIVSSAVPRTRVDRRNRQRNPEYTRVPPPDQGADVGKHRRRRGISKGRLETGRSPIEITPSGSRHLDSRDGGLAGAAILLGIEGNLLTLAETAQAGALQRGGVDENVLAAIVWLDESEAFLIVVELYCAVG